ncbi:MAG: DoxX family protein [Flavobacteriales bacterium]
MKKTKMLYWVFTILLCLMLFADGFGGITQQQAGQDVLQHLGYPMYLLIITGVAKWLALIAILQSKFKAIKEWAYAGISINFIGAFASRAFVRDSFFETIFPIFTLGFMFISYFLWKRVISTFTNS